MDLYEQVKMLVAENEALKKDKERLQGLLGAGVPRAKRVSKPRPAKTAKAKPASANGEKRGRGRPPIFTDEEASVIAGEHADGKTVADLAAKYEVTAQTISKTLKRVADA